MAESSPTSPSPSPPAERRQPNARPAAGGTDRPGALPNAAPASPRNAAPLGGWPADLLIGLSLAVLAMLGMCAAATRQYSFDAISYARQVETFQKSGQLGWLLHPHHVLFNGIEYAWWRLLHGQFARPLEAQQLLNGIAGGAAVGLAYAGAREATGSRMLGLGVAILLWASYGLWLIATDGGIYSLGFAMFLTVAWLAFCVVDRPRVGVAVAMGAAAALAALIHQMHVLLAPVLLLAPLLSRAGAAPGSAGEWRTRVRLAVAAACAYGGVLVLTYYLASVSLGYRTPAAFLSWITTYGRDGRWWSFHILRNLGLDLSALAHDFSVNTERLLHALGRLSDPAGLPLLLLLGLAVAATWRAVPSRGSQLLLCAAWVLSYAAFFTVWVPGYFAYWMPVAFGLLLVAALLVEGIALSLAGERLPAWSGSALRAGALALFCLSAWRLSLSNMDSVRKRQDPSMNRYLTIAREVEAHTRGGDLATRRPGDLIVLTGAGNYATVETYVPYFANRDVLTLMYALKHEGPGSGKTRQDALEWLRASFEQRWRRGAQVYVLGDVLGMRDAYPALQQRYGLSFEETKSYFDTFQREPAFTTRGQPAYRLLPRPAGVGNELPVWKPGSTGKSNKQEAPPGR